jgi:integrase/recombinase XerD
MIDKVISPLRQRMIEDMTIRNIGPKTQIGYIRAVKNFAAFLGHSPAKANAEDIRRFQLHMTSTGVGVPSINTAVSALRFLFKITLRRSDVTEQMPFIHEAQRLPVVLSIDEVARLLAAAPGLTVNTRRRSASPMQPDCAFRRSSRSRSATSIAPAWSFGSSKAKEARIDT